MITGLRERKKLETRKALAKAALRLAAERGFECIRVEDIAAEAGVSLRTFNNYFSSKEEAVVSLAVDRVLSVSAALRQRPAGETLAGALSHAFIGQYIADGEPDREWMARIHLAISTPALLGEYLKAIVRSEDSLAEAIAERTGAGPGNDLDSHVLAAAVCAGVHAAIRYWRDSGTTDSLAAVLRRAIAPIVSQEGSSNAH